MPIALAPLDQTHLSAVERMLEDEDVLRFTRVPVPVPEGFAQSWLDAYGDGQPDDTSVGFAVIDDAGAFLGLALAPTIEAKAATAEIGYVVVPAARGRGVATEALRLITDWAFAERGLERLELRISVANEASKRVAMRCGYRREGVLRSAYFKDGLREDTEIWSRLPGDPAPG
jgi:RimJ/RimL family protein N-acetyltransferase